LPVTSLVGVVEDASTEEPESASKPTYTTGMLQVAPVFVKVTHALYDSSALFATFTGSSVSRIWLTLQWGAFVEAA
jgi:hypothetical protein